MGLLSTNFPEYIGEIRRAHIQSTKREEELADTEYGYFTSTINDDGTQNGEDDVTVNQGESAVIIEYPENLLETQVTEIEAYAALYAIGGYTYDNLVQELDDEVCNSVEKDGEETDSEPDGEDDGIDTDKKIDEEELISKKSPYEQKFIREFRQLFSETLNPSRYLRFPPDENQVEASPVKQVRPIPIQVQTKDDTYAH